MDIPPSQLALIRAHEAFRPRTTSISTTALVDLEATRFRSDKCSLCGTYGHHLELSGSAKWGLVSVPITILVCKPCLPRASSPL